MTQLENSSLKLEFSIRSGSVTESLRAFTIALALSSGFSISTSLMTRVFFLIDSLIAFERYSFAVILKKVSSELTLYLYFWLNELILCVKSSISFLSDNSSSDLKKDITLSGGEPSLQTGLKYFNNEIHKLGLGIIMFSGKSKAYLDKSLVESVDLLIDGPFIEEQLDDKRVLLGSKNKELSFITDRYKKEERYFNNSIAIEEVTAEDYIFINGD